MKITVHGINNEGTAVVAYNIIRYLNSVDILTVLSNPERHFDNIEAGLKDLGSREALESVRDMEIDEPIIVELIEDTPTKK